MTSLTVCGGDGGFHLIDEAVQPDKDMFRHQTGPDLAVSLRSMDGIDILS